MHKELSLADLENNLRDANEALLAAERQSSTARHNEAAARNRVNDVQKQLDAAIAKMKKDAPRDTDWTRRPMQAVSDA